jgi:MYXO-CTERM domain-containing protein
MRALARIASLALGAALSLGAAPAAAYCRSTTCAGDCPRDADGCKTTGHPLAWPGVCVGVSLQRDGSVNLPMSDVRPAVEASFVAWSDLDCGAGPASIAFSELDDVSCRRAEYNDEGPNANVILFQDTQWRYQGSDNTLAKTTVTFDADTGAILDADIEINHAYNEFTVGDDPVVYDLRSIVTHELGHLLGLDHTPDLEATMNAVYDEGSTSQRSLAPDDLAGLCAAYPPGRGGACDPTPRNGLGDACGGGKDDDGGGGGCAVVPGEGGGAGALLASILLLLPALRRRRRCP